MASPPNKRQKMENVEDATGCPPSTSEPVDVEDGAGDSSTASEPVDVNDGAGDSSTASEPVDVEDGAGDSSRTSEPVDVEDGAGDSSRTSEPVDVEDGAGDSSTASEPVDVKDGAGDSSTASEPVDVKDGAGDSSTASEPVDVEDGAGDSSRTSEPVDVEDGAGDSSRTSEPVDVKDGAGDSSTASKSVIPKSQDFRSSSEDFSIIVKSVAFIDKTLLIKSMFPDEPSQEDEIMKVLITAPHRFGKSVNMDMLKKFFEIEVDEKGDPKTCVKKEAGNWIEDDEKTPTKNFKLFKDNNLKIYQCRCSPNHSDEQIKGGLCASRQFFYEHCGQHPVMFVSFKPVKCGTMKQMKNSFQGVLQDAYSNHEYLGRSTSHLSESEKTVFDLYFDEIKCRKLTEYDVEIGLKTLAKFLHKQFGRKVIILIDEFDAPIMQLIHSNEDRLWYIKKVIEYISAMVSSVFKGNPCVLGGLINACILLATVLSSGANNIISKPFLDDHMFSEFYGVKKDEVDALLKGPLFREFDEKEILEYYNGYTIYGNGTKMYCLYSLVRYLESWADSRASSKEESRQISIEQKYKPKSFWVDNHGVTDLEEMFVKDEIRETFNVLQCKGIIEISEPVEKLQPKHVLQLKSMLDASKRLKTDDINLFLLYLKDRGYFNVKEKDESFCKLEIPNGEIKNQITKKMYNRSYCEDKYLIGPNDVSKYKDAILKLDWGVEESFQVLADVIANMFPGNVERPINRAELLGLLYAWSCSIQGTVVHSEIFSQSGKTTRLDLMIYRTEGTGIIVEVKRGQNESAQEGLDQIFNKGYYRVFKTLNLPIHKHKIFLGLHFNNSTGAVTVCACSAGSGEDDEEFAKSKKDCITKTSNQK